MTIFNVTSGHPLSGATLSSGGFAFVYSGGEAISTTVGGQAAITVLSGGMASVTVLSGGGFQYVSSGGQAIGTVLTGGTEAVYAGGSASFSVVSAGGSEDAYYGGTTFGAVLSGGLEGVYSGATASDTVVSSGGGEYVYSGGTATGTAVDGSGSLAVNAGGNANGIVVSGGGTIAVYSGAHVDFLTMSRGGSIDLPGLAYGSGGSAIVSNADLLTVNEGGSSVKLQLSGLYEGESFQVAKESGGSGTVVTLTEPPRTLAWLGTRDTNFANAANWDDLTNGLDPAVAPPNATDTTEFLSGGGTITGTGTASALEFGGTASWQVTSGASLSATSEVIVGQGVAGTLLVNDGASVDGLGTFDDISGGANEAGSVSVEGSGSSWKSTGELIVGDAGVGGLTVGGAAIVSAAAAGALPALALGAGASGDGSLLVTGLGSEATFAGELNVGEAGAGELTIGNRATVQAGNDAALDPSRGLDVAELAGGLGVVTVSGTQSLLNNVGRFVIGDAGLGQLTIESGATVVTAPSTASGLPGAVIANTTLASGSAVDVAGSASNWQVAGLLDVGVAGAGSLQLSGGGTVSAGSFDAGLSATAVAQIGLSGVGTELIIANAATVADDGTGVLSVLSGATFTAASLTIGSQIDSSGALVVSGAGSLVRLSGALNIGTANGTGDLTVGPNATIDALVVNLQGQEVIEGGVVDPTVQLIGQGQTAGGFGTISAGDIVDEGVIQAGQSKASQRRLLVQGTILGGGTLAINGTVQPSKPVGALEINAGGTLELSGAVLNAATTTFTDNLTPADTYTVTNSVMDVAFADAAGVLKLDDIAGFAGTITTWQAGDSFVISGGTLSGLAVSNGDTLQFSDTGAGAGHGGVDRIIFASPIGATGFNIVNSDTVQVACFARGTLIATERRSVPVETLVVGDRVTLAGGRGHEPVVWLGQRAIDCRAHPNPDTVRPIRIAAGVFGANLPARDLFVSPDHAIYLDGVLIPARLLANETAIRQVNMRHVDYYHIELARHDVILAEGLPVESYLDTGDRSNFSGERVTTLHPGFAARRWEMAGCAPLVLTGAKLDDARRHLAKFAPSRDGRKAAERRRDHEA